MQGLEVETFIADKAYDADHRVREPLQEKGICTVIPPKKNRVKTYSYDAELYKARHLIENFFAKIKQYRAIATRYDKMAQVFQSACLMAGVMIWLI